MALCAAAVLAGTVPSEACTGISLKAKDGSIVLPKVLVPYMDGVEVIRPE